MEEHIDPNVVRLTVICEKVLLIGCVCAGLSMSDSLCKVTDVVVVVVVWVQDACAAHSSSIPWTS